MKNILLTISILGLGFSGIAQAEQTACPAENAVYSWSEEGVGATIMGDNSNYRWSVPNGWRPATAITNLAMMPPVTFISSTVKCQVASPNSGTQNCTAPICNYQDKDGTQLSIQYDQSISESPTGSAKEVSPGKYKTTGFNPDVTSQTMQQPNWWNPPVGTWIKYICEGKSQGQPPSACQWD